MSERLEQFRHKLESFYWNYDFSDDQDVWRAGRTCQQMLFAEAMQIGPDALDLYFSFLPGREV